jgi:hypothetical protein
VRARPNTIAVWEDEGVDKKAPRWTVERVVLFKSGIGIPVRDGDTPESLLERAQDSSEIRSGCYQLTGEIEDEHWPDNDIVLEDIRGKWKTRWFRYQQVCPCPQH